MAATAMDTELPQEAAELARKGVNVMATLAQQAAQAMSAFEASEMHNSDSTKAPLILRSQAEAIEEIIGTYQTDTLISLGMGANAIKAEHKAPDAQHHAIKEVIQNFADILAQQEVENSAADVAEEMQVAGEVKNIASAEQQAVVQVMQDSMQACSEILQNSVEACSMYEQKLLDQKGRLYNDAFDGVFCIEVDSPFRVVWSTDSGDELFNTATMDTGLATYCTEANSAAFCKFVCLHCGGRDPSSDVPRSLTTLRDFHGNEFDVDVRILEWTLDTSPHQVVLGMKLCGEKRMINDPEGSLHDFNFSVTENDVSVFDFAGGVTQKRIAEAEITEASTQTDSVALPRPRPPCLPNAGLRQGLPQVPPSPRGRNCSARDRRLSRSASPGPGASSGRSSSLDEEKRAFVFDGHWAIDPGEHSDAPAWLLFLTISGKTVICGDGTLGCLQLQQGVVCFEGGRLILETKDSLCRVGKSGRRNLFSRIDMRETVFDSHEEDEDMDEQLPQRADTLMRLPPIVFSDKPI